MNFLERNQKIKALREEYQRINDEFMRSRRDLEKDAKKVFEQAWQKKFPKNLCYALPTVSNDQAEIFLYGVTSHKKGYGEQIAFLEKKTWGIQDPQDDHKYGLPVEGPFPYDDLIKGISEIQDENPGLVVTLVELKVREKVEEIRSFRAIQCLFPNSEVNLLGSGEKWYVGWDISDKYIRVSIDGTEWVWWSTDAHGGPLDNSAMKGTPAFDAFEHWLKSDS